ncbi:hypothetical protein MTR_8g461980 [Medicago truncatula]|uniref:Uncharacterized protein n=1 Tax=Medicago truncatula TaxID=3880 RepID=A0A072TQN3_MEDTR|nr:hypothetical protein MTR_8g461980 [Medicago truncatula]
MGGLELFPLKKNLFSREIKSESNANQMALTSEKWRDRNGNFTGEDVVRWLIKSSLGLVDTRYYTHTRLSYERCWTGSISATR